MKSSNPPKKQMGMVAKAFMLSAFLLTLSSCASNDDDETNSQLSDDNTENIAENTENTDDTEGNEVSDEQVLIAERIASFFEAVAEQGVDVERILELEGIDRPEMGSEPEEEDGDASDADEDEAEQQSATESGSDDDGNDSTTAEPDDASEEVMTANLREYFLDTYGEILDTYFHGETTDYSDDELMSRVETIINASLFVGGIDVSELYADESLAESGAYDQFDDLGQPVVEPEYIVVDNEEGTAEAQIFPLDLFRSMEPGLDSLDDTELIDIIVSEGGAPAQFVVNLEHVDDQWWIVDDFGQTAF